MGLHLQQKKTLTMFFIQILSHALFFNLLTFNHFFDFQAAK